jgi:hypothetical protein
MDRAARLGPRPAPPVCRRGKETASHPTLSAVDDVVSMSIEKHRDSANAKRSSFPDKTIGRRVGDNRRKRNALSFGTFFRRGNELFIFAKDPAATSAPHPKRPPRPPREDATRRAPGTSPRRRSLESRLVPESFDPRPGRGSGDLARRSRLPGRSPTRGEWRAIW